MPAPHIANTREGGNGPPARVRHARTYYGLDDQNADRQIGEHQRRHARATPRRWRTSFTNTRTCAIARPRTSSLFM